MVQQSLCKERQEAGVRGEQVWGAANSTPWEQSLGDGKEASLFLREGSVSFDQRRNGVPDSSR